MSSAISFLDNYASYLQHTVDMVNELTFKWCMKNPVDMTIINHIEMNIKRDQTTYENICKTIDEKERAKHVSH